MTDEARPIPNTHYGRRGRGGWLLVVFGVLLALAALYFIGGGAYPSDGAFRQGKNG